jgi:hypothetical protein
MQEHTHSAPPSSPLCEAMLAFQGRAGQWVPLFVVGLAFSTAGTQGSSDALSWMALSLPGLEGAPRSPVRARCPHECTKQTLAGLRPRGTGGPGRGYERCRVARPEHLNLWWPGRTSRRLFDFDPERAAVGTLMTSSKLSQPATTDCCHAGSGGARSLPHRRHECRRSPAQGPVANLGRARAW